MRPPVDRHFSPFSQNRRVVVLTLGNIGYFCGERKGVFKANKEKLTHEFLYAFLELALPTRYAQHELMRFFFGYDRRSKFAWFAVT